MKKRLSAREEADRVAAICERAHLVIKLGKKAVSKLEAPLPTCACRYPDGEPRWTDPWGHVKHHCGR